MPVSLLRGGKGPGKGIPVQTVVDVKVLGDIAVVIVIDKGMAIDRVVERERGDNQQETENDIALFGRGEKTRLLRGWQQKDLTTEDTEDTEALVVHVLSHAERWPFLGV